MPFQLEQHENNGDLIKTHTHTHTHTQKKNDWPSKEHAEHLNMIKGLFVFATESMFKIS